MDGLSLFNSLVMGDNNTLEIEEFVMGCMYLLGNAQNVDMKTMMRENKRLTRRLTNETACIVKKLDNVCDTIRVLALRCDRRSNNDRFRDPPREYAVGADISKGAFADLGTAIESQSVCGDGSPTPSLLQESFTDASGEKVDLNEDFPHNLGAGDRQH